MRTGDVVRLDGRGFRRVGRAAVDDISLAYRVTTEDGTAAAGRHQPTRTAPSSRRSRASTA